MSTAATYLGFLIQRSSLIRTMFWAWSICTADGIVDTPLGSWRLALEIDSVGLLLARGTSRAAGGMNITSRWWKGGRRLLALFTKKKGHICAAAAVVLKDAVGAGFVWWAKANPVG